MARFCMWLFVLFVSSCTVVGRNREPVNAISTSVSSPVPIKEKLLSIKLIASPLVLKTPEGDCHLITADISSPGLKDVTCRISSDEWAKPEVFALGDIPIGTLRHEFKVPVLSDHSSINVSLKSSTTEKEWSNIVLPNVRKWTIYLVQHVHTDIGYTRPQTEILPEHLRYIDYVLDYCDLTDNYPDDAKFRWTCEISWAVREYLNRRPAEQIQRLKKRIDEGRVEITGMFLNMSEIATESSLAASLQPIRRFKQDYHIPVRTALQNDVNGAAWCLADYFNDMGIRYLMMGINKTRSLLPFDKPTAFWWESPSKKRVLAYRADHYMTGNSWLIHEGNVEAFKSGLVDYLRSLEKRNYPYDRISVQFSGYRTDNSPPAMIACDLVKEWNETYAWPKLRMATAHEFLEYIERNHASELPVHRQAWPDWWTDGFGSAARETAASRQTHAAMQANQALLAMASLLGANIPRDTMERAVAVQEALLFYDEHTYGAAESISDPMAENSMVQWGEKASYVWDAVKNAHLLREEGLGLLQGFVPRADVPTIAIFNTLNWKRSGLIEVFIDHELLPFDRQFRIVDTESGEWIPAQPLQRRTEGTYWALWARNVRPLGYKVYRIEVSEGRRTPRSKTDSSPAKIENAYYSLTLSPDTGAITSLSDKEMDLELVDRDCQWSVGQLIYERLSGGREFHRDAFHRSPLKDVRLQNGATGPVWKSIEFSAEMEGCAGVKGEIRLFETAKRIDLLYSIRKVPITDPEAVYVSFPFRWPNGQITYEAQGGLVTPGTDQLPGSSSDWQTVQNFISVRSDDGQIIFGSDEVPLVQFGDINLGKWQEIAKVENPYVYSWIMNNYWFTNFRASQEGEFKWSYYFTSTKDTSNIAASRFGWGSRIPLVSRVFPPGVGDLDDAVSSLSIFQFSVPNLLLVDARPSYYDEGVILHFREIDGKEAILDFGKQSFVKEVRRIDEVNVLEETLKEKINTLAFAPFEVKFVKVALER